MLSSIANDSGSESPLSTISGTPSLPDSPSYSTSSDTLRVEAPAPAPPTASTSAAKGKDTAPDSSRRVSSASKSAASHDRATSSSSVKVPSASNSVYGHRRTESSSSTIKVATPKRAGTSLSTVNDINSDTTTSDEDGDGEAFFPNIQVASSSAKSTTDSNTIANSSSPVPASSLPAVTANKVDAKKRNRDNFENDAAVGDEKDKGMDGGTKEKRARVLSKKAREASQSDEDYVQSLTASQAKKVNDGKGATPPKTTIKFTSGCTATAAATKAKEDAIKEEVQTPKKQRDRPRKHPKAEEKEKTFVEAAKLVVKKDRPTKRKLDLSIDMNDSDTGLLDKDNVNSSTTLSDAPAGSSADLNDSPSPPAKKACTRKVVTPPKGLIEPTRKSQRAPKLSPKAREALGANAPKVDDSAELAWGYQEDGSWNEPKVLAKAHHEHEKKEGELAKKNSKGTGVKNRSRVHSVRWWKEKFGAKLPEPDYGRAQEEEEAKQNLNRSQLLSDLKSDEEEMREMSEFYKIEMSVEHYHAMNKEVRPYNWHSEDPHHVEAPESSVRTPMPEPKWKTTKYEAELVGKFDNYSAPFKRFWEEPEDSNVRGE